MAIDRQALWASGHDESVEVNQRALIDKVLARYSAEFTVFRELLQNSDDAQSKAVEIRFETRAYLDKKNGVVSKEGKELAVEDGLKEKKEEELPDLKTALVHQWTFKNNGMVFRDEDWSRLKKIAEGNPDEEKIGAFGVGFYSLFSVTEDPFVSSGGQWMGFYWKDQKDQLYVRRGALPDPDSPEHLWTCFEMPLREPVPIPSAFDFTRFLASSITFMAHLSQVDVYMDDKRLSRLCKTSGMPKELGLPIGLQKKTPTGYMTVKTLRSTPLNINAEVMRWVYESGTTKPTAPAVAAAAVMKAAKQSTGFFSSIFSSLVAPQPAPVATRPVVVAPPVKIDLTEISKTSVTLTIFSADADVKLDRKIAAELHRSTKKNPPVRVRYDLIYTGKDEYDLSQEEDKKISYATGSIFQGLRADLQGTGSGRIFIGHSTAQTTGIGGHMSARFIPTVERESIDLVDRHVAIWNRELLYVGGYLSRAAYEMELASVRARWDGATSRLSGLPDESLQVWLREQALHSLKFFTFHASTPSAEVADIMVAAFFSCSTPQAPFTIMSSAGVREATRVRMPDPQYSAFLKQLPVLGQDIIDGAPRMLHALQSRGMIRAITGEDVLNELKARPLPEEEMLACLKWWCTSNRGASSADLRMLLDAAVLTTGMPGGADEKIIPLSSIRSFLNTRGIGAHIPLDGPLPSDLLPQNISKKMTVEELSRAFSWSELTIIDWLTHITHPEVMKNTEFNLTLSASWAERVLLALMRAWPSLAKPSKDAIIALLATKTCVPTSAGLKTPRESYFNNAKLFNDLPLVTLPSGTTISKGMNTFLADLGVRKHAELQVVFDRMIKTGDWTISDLTKYLVSVRSDLTQEELARLKLTSAFSKEETASDPAGGPGKRTVRYQAKQLYEPLEVFRQLKLPLIDWGTQSKWRGNSDEAKFLFEIGLLRFPPLEILIGLCASSDATIRPVALKYLLDNISTKYSHYHPDQFPNEPFLPTIKNNTLCMGTYRDVFSNRQWATLGFMVLQPNSEHPDMATKLRVSEHPTTAALIALLAKTPPQDELQAKRWFEILATRKFQKDEYARMGKMNIVPVKGTPASEKKAAVPTRWLAPTQCYFGGESRAQFHSQLFIFVNFDTLANAFLQSCGTTQEPSVEEIGLKLLADPHEFYRLADGRDNFLNELRNIAVNSRQLSSSTVARMKKAAILLGSQRKRRHSEKAVVDIDDDEWDLQFDLKRPDEIVIVDDTNAYQLFGNSIFAAPQEDILEGFYILLGSKRLSTLIREEHEPGSEVKNSPLSARIRNLVLQRLPIFLHEHAHGSQTRFKYDWMSRDGNFVVRTFRQLSVTRTLQYGSTRLSEQQTAYAVAQHQAVSRPVNLWLLHQEKDQVDLYEVATALCRVIFKAHKVNDGLLFMTILSTDLKALKRRGYNIDRILAQEKMAEKMAADARAQEQALLSKPPITKFHSDGPFPPKMPTTTVGPPPAASPSKIEEKPIAKSKLASTNTPNALQQLKSKFKFSGSGGQSRIDAPLSPVPAAPLPPTVPEHTKPKGSDVTPKSNISSNISQAIQACRPESGNLIHNRAHMEQVKEALNEGYCDISGQAGDLDHVGDMYGIRIFTSRDMPPSQTFMTDKHDVISRFIHVVIPLAEVYTLPLKSLHIFCDATSGIIAFNRNGSVFLNLRFYEAWHDEDVKHGNLQEAYISWYFSLAHEIAHNLVKPHNSEHEFYFSSICEKYMMDLVGVLSNGPLISI